MTYHNWLERARVPGVNLGACRLSDYESETLDFHQLDLTGASLEFYISEYPSSKERLATFIVQKSTETKSYQAFIDECRFEVEWIPCGDTASDSMTSSVVNISSAQSALENLPYAKERGEPVELYYTLRQTAPREEVLLAGKFYLTETA